MLSYQLPTVYTGMLLQVGLVLNSTCHFAKLFKGTKIHLLKVVGDGFHCRLGVEFNMSFA
jgi:hypothetical protein